MGKEQITVELMDYMGSDLSTVNSARVSFSKESELESVQVPAVMSEDNSFIVTGSRFEQKLKETDIKLIKYLANNRHTTPFRHNQIAIRCKAPIFLVRQLGKHQAGLSWNEVSRRYVDSEPEFYIPDEWRGRPDDSIKQGSGELYEDQDRAKENYEETLYHISLYYNGMIERGISPEMARIVLPQSMMTEWVWSGNLLAFAHVYKERSDPHAQLEAQWFAEHLDKVIRPLFPISWEALVG